MRLFCVAFLVLSTASAWAGTFVYVAERGDKTIGVFQLDEENGSLNRVSEATLEGAPGAMVADTAKERLYVINRDVPSIETFAINSNHGGLALLKSVEAPSAGAYLYLDRENKWLLAAYFSAGLASVSPISSEGLALNPETVINLGPKAHCIQVSPDNQFAFVPHTGELNCVDQLIFEVAAGSLSRNDPGRLSGAPGAGPRHMQFHPNGKWVYLVNEQGRSVTHCHYDAKSGTLEKGDTLSTLPEGWNEKGSCADIELSSDGKFVYASNRGHDSIAIFSVDLETGQLNSLGQESTGQTPRSFNLVPGNGERFLVAAGQGDNTLTVYERDGESGALTKLETYPSGKSPGWVLGLNFP